MTSTKSASENSERTNMSVQEIAKNLNDAGILPEFGYENSRLLIKMWRTLGQGWPVTQEMTAKVAAEVGMSFEAADEFLRQSTERDADNNIIGLIGLLLNQGWAHRLIANGTKFRTGVPGIRCSCQRCWERRSRLNPSRRSSARRSASL